MQIVSGSRSVGNSGGDGTAGFLDWVIVWAIQFITIATGKTNNSNTKAIYDVSPVGSLN